MHDVAHAGKIVFAEIGRVQQRVGHGGDHAHVGGVMFLDQLEDQRGFEAAHHHLLDAEHGGGLRAAPAVGVEQRNGVQIHHGVDIFVHAGRVQGVQIERAMREHDAFGRAGAAAGIEQLGDGVFVESKMSARSGLAFVEQLFVGQIGDGDLDR